MLDFLGSSTTTRKRCRPCAAFGLVLVALCCESTAFTTSGYIGSSSMSIRPQFSAKSGCTTQLLLRLATSKDYETNILTSSPPRLSSEEQNELLKRAIELRRIKQIESDLALRKKTSCLLSVRCNEAGYGEDIVAYENAMSSGERAREHLITTNIGLVHFCVNEIVGKKNGRRSRLNSLSREDLIQEGCIGLARAIDRWNPEIGGKFSTYAVYWIRAAILRCIAEKDDLLRVPEHVSATVRKMTKGARKLGIDISGQDFLSSVYSSGASWKEAQAAKALAEEAGLTDRQLSDAMKIRNRRVTGGYVAFESWMQKGRDMEADISITSTTDESLQAMEVEHLKKTLGRYLRPKEMEALFWRYGLLNENSDVSIQVRKKTKNYVKDVEKELYASYSERRTPSLAVSPLPVGGRWGEAMSFSEVGKKMEVSAEYGRRLCHAALKKLRQAAKEGHLEPALLF